VQIIYHIVSYRTETVTQSSKLIMCGHIAVEIADEFSD